MCKSPCCDKGELRNIEGNSLSVDCSNCGTVYDLLESADFKKYDSPFKKPVVVAPSVPETPHEEEPENCLVCDRRLDRCICGQDEGEYEREYDRYEEEEI